MAEGARLESVYAGNRIGGSNPSLSAITLYYLVLVSLMMRGTRCILPKALSGRIGLGVAMTAIDLRAHSSTQYWPAICLI